ncbi:hypothetical protein FACS1894164_14910 [Spirochaetia bacterium]|nr:hypothetical protein FACS1894164_14910 [Spirochaetia bacterium]
MKRFWLCAVLGCAAGMAGALDFGFVLDQTPGWNSEDKFFYDAAVSGWFSMFVGDNAQLYTSVKGIAKYRNTSWSDNPGPVVFDVGRFEFSYRPLPWLSLNVGRQYFRDSAEVVVSGLVDGASLSLGIGPTTLSAGIFYTGLLYKNTANITLTSDDSGILVDTNEYFASRRLLASARWVFPGQMNTLTLDGLAQIDLNDRPDKVNSQYISLQYALRTKNWWTFTPAVVVGFAQDPKAASAFTFAAGINMDWDIPKGLNDRFSFKVWTGSGSFRDTIAAFRPITGASQGRILDANLSGLIMARVGYTLRIFSIISLGAEFSYFARTDFKTVTSGSSLDTTKGYLLGGEYFANMTVAPTSDLTFVLSGGSFLPGLGDAFIAGTPDLWKIALQAILAF